MKNALLIFLSLAFLSFTTFAQEDSTSTKPKKRFSFSGLPVVAYDADMGFQYGAVGNMYDFGDWSSYPEYRHAVKVEISRFTCDFQGRIYGEKFRWLAGIGIMNFKTGTVDVDRLNKGGHRFRHPRQ